MVKIEFDVVPTLEIFKSLGYAVISLNQIQISKFLFDDFVENSRYEDWAESKYVLRPCIDFYQNGVLINVVRNVEVEIIEV